MIFLDYSAVAAVIKKKCSSDLTPALVEAVVGPAERSIEKNIVVLGIAVGAACHGLDLVCWFWAQTVYFFFWEHLPPVHLHYTH